VVSHCGEPLTSDHVQNVKSMWFIDLSIISTVRSGEYAGCVRPRKNGAGWNPPIPAVNEWELHGILVE
jgi:hypothetical protein